jgi:5-methylcytosine-specific restriction endonuclease McrA
MADPEHPRGYAPHLEDTAGVRDAHTEWDSRSRSLAGAPGSAEFGKRVLQLLDEGKTTSTYKYAVLLALTDLCLERYGENSDAIPVREIAARVLQLYWPQSAPYVGQSAAVVLAQNRSGQAEILTEIRRFRERFGADPWTSLSRARLADPARYERLLDFVEWKLVEMPLPRLQIVGETKTEFLYRIDWDEQIRREDARSPSFDAHVHLQAGVAENLVRLSGLLRPLIQRSWASMVAQIRHNRSVTDEARLEEFLFGAQRIALDPVRADLRELQNDRCFYCNSQFSGTPDIDHFIPWTRHADNGIDNLVAADPRCNNAKRDFLACGEHVERWVTRINSASSTHQIDQIAARARWDRHPDRTLGVARSIYARLPGDVRLWRRPRLFTTVQEDRSSLALALTASARGALVTSIAPG